MAAQITVVNMIPNLLSGETNQDSGPNVAVNPANPLEIAATSFTPSPNAGSPNSPVLFSSDGGSTWSLKDLIARTPVRDQTLRFASVGGTLYAGVLWGSGATPFNALVGTGDGKQGVRIVTGRNNPFHTLNIGQQRIGGVMPRLNLMIANTMIANTGDFGKTCIGSFVDEPLILNNGGKCTLFITGMNSSSADFLVPQVLSFPLVIAPGDSLPAPIRFAPTGFGPKSATLTVTGNDPARCGGEFPFSEQLGRHINGSGAGRWSIDLWGGRERRSVRFVWAV
ncbi:MAG: BNR/Asp-box repeat protein [Chthonomonadaceae bacterium]|nr:BNR/Asp-box repeat protein [Chthonomonadaceae bacterium]